jgi:hypothetical protein
MTVTVFLRIFRKKWIKSHENTKKTDSGEFFLSDEIEADVKAARKGKCR